MAKLYAGFVIKNARIKMNITQNALCFGICSVSTLHRIEQGKNTPSIYVFRHLMGRLGYDAEKYFLNASTQSEISFFGAYNEVRSLVMADKFDEAAAALGNLEAVEQSLLATEGHELRKQMVSSIRCGIAQGKKDDAASIISMTLEALSLTLPDFDETIISNYLFSYTEISLINTLAISYARLGDFEKKIDILYQLKASIDKHYLDDSEKPGYVLTLYNLTNALGLAGRHEDVLIMCNVAIRHCIKFKKLYLLPHIKFNKGCALFYMGQKVEYQQLIIESVYALLHNEDYRDAKLRKNYAEANLGVEFPYWRAVDGK